MTFLGILIATLLFAANIVTAQIDDLEVEEDFGFYEIVDLDDIFADHGDNLIFLIQGAPRQLNMAIDEDNVLSVDADENYNLEDGVEITIIAINQNGEFAEQSFVIVIYPVNDEPFIVARIEDVVANENSGEIIIADLDDVFGDVDAEDAQLEFLFDDAPEELNMIINRDNVLLINPEEGYNLPDGVKITHSNLMRHCGQHFY